jgi:LPS O-antigen subunit length determinant protein (WzzB/FepE family)
MTRNLMAAIAIILALALSLAGNAYLIVSDQQWQSTASFESTTSNNAAQTASQTVTIIEPVPTTVTSMVTATKTIYQSPISAHAANQSMGRRARCIVEHNFDNRLFSLS